MANQEFDYRYHLIFPAKVYKQKALQEKKTKQKKQSKTFSSQHPIKSLSIRYRLPVYIILTIIFYHKNDIDVNKKPINKKALKLKQHPLFTHQ